MKKDNIVQFVCFVTNLGVDEFSERWKAYASGLLHKRDDILLETAAPDGKTKYRYISQHDCGNGDFRFDFLKGKNHEHFREYNARVVQAGGYAAVNGPGFHNETENDVRVMVFVDHRETDLDFFYEQPCRHLTVYKAYYESCRFSYILEFIVAGEDAPALLEQLQTKEHSEAALYRECTAVHS